MIDRNTVMFALALLICLACAILAGFAYWLWWTGRKTISDRAKELSIGWRVIVAATAAFVFGLIVGIVIGHFGWAMQ